MTREPDANVNELFINRWSPRAFADKPISDDILNSVFEAARWAPSSYNEQPWLFMVGTDEEKEQYLNLLNDFNQSWAKTAPVIGFIFAKQHFSKNNNENHVADFDAGSAWMSMTLQARMHGLYTHGMAGIKYDMIADTLDVPDDYKPIAGFALGYQGDSSQLPDDLQAQEEPPSDRKPLDEVWQRGTYE